MTRRDRYGEPLDEDQDDQPAVHSCRDGWLSEPDDDVARPCLTCRPWVARSSEALRRRLTGPPR